LALKQTFLYVPEQASVLAVKCEDLLILHTAERTADHDTDIDAEKLNVPVFINRVLRRVFGPKRDEVTGGWRKPRNERAP
jgi:hypothetical protein